MMRKSNKTVLAQGRFLYDGLTELLQENFPKQCHDCGRHYANMEDYLVQTRPISPGCTGLKASEDDCGRPVVEVFRNCLCGSTLMDFAADRRDTSESGVRRREKFARLVDSLELRAVGREQARSELLKALNGVQSELLEQWLGGRRLF